MSGNVNGKVIGFCGAGGVGKTTTASALLGHLGPMGYEFLPSSSREVFKKMGVLTEADQNNLSPERRWELQKAIQLAHAEKMQHRDKSKNLICDRTQLDQYSYALQYCSTALSHVDITWLEELTYYAMQQFDLVFYFAPHAWLSVDDGMRETRPGPRILFDRILQGALNHFDIDFLLMPTTTPTLRCARVLQVMNDKDMLDVSCLTPEMFELISPLMGDYHG